MVGSVKIIEEQCKGWTSDGSKKSWPGSIRAQCPFCGDWAVFTIYDYAFNSRSMIGSARSSCGGCQGKPQFAFVFSETENALRSGRPELILMFPGSKIHYPLPDIPAVVPEAIRRTMVSTVETYNARFYDAAATSGRKTLEGIFKHLVDEKRREKRLYELIEIVGKETDFAEPITRLSDAVRNGGNLAAHFDINHEPNERLARQIIELVDYLISYLYILPDKIKELENYSGKTVRKK